MKAIGLLVVIVAAVTFAGRLPVPESALRVTGRMLVVDEPVASADIIVVSLTSGGAGVLEAADLVKGGVAKRVAVFIDPPTAEDQEFMRRGLPSEDAGAWRRQQLSWLGVSDVISIPLTNPGTAGETKELQAWCAAHRIGSVVFVTSRDHSRRVRRVIARAMHGHPTRITVQPARHSSFDPERWWQTRGGTRTLLVELQKLLLDVVMHPLPP